MLVVLEDTEDVVVVVFVVVVVVVAPGITMKVEKEDNDEHC